MARRFAPCKASTYPCSNTPPQVKQAIAGKGSADKLQVQHMVKILLNIQGDLQIDASDALGISLCHAHYQQTANRLQQGYQ